MATQRVPGNGLVPSLGTHPLWSQVLLLAQDSLGALALPGIGIKTNKAHAIHAPTTCSSSNTLLSWLP